MVATMIAEDTVTVHIFGTVDLYESGDLRKGVQLNQERVALRKARDERPAVVVRRAGKARHMWVEATPFTIPLGMVVTDPNLGGKMLLTTVLPVREYDDEWFERAEAALED